MAIGYLGIPGSGKSHTLVEKVIIPELKAGKRVYTNIPLNTGNMTRIHKLTTAQINNLFMYPDETDETGKVHQPLAKLMIPSEDPNVNVLIKSCVVHDEVQTSLPFDERRSNPELKRLRDFVSHHRHYDIEWHWATQSEHLVDVTLRRLSDTAYLFKNLKHTTRGKLAKYGAYRMRLYMMTDGEVDKEMITEEVVDINPQTFMCYKSFVGNDVAGKFKAPMPRFLRNGLIIAGVMMFVIIPWSVYKTISWYNKLTTKKGHQTSQKKGIENHALAVDSAYHHPIGPSRIPGIEYDGYWYLQRPGGESIFILLKNGSPVYECRDPLFSFASTSCGDKPVYRVGRSSLPNGLGASGPSGAVVSGVGTSGGIGQ